MPKQQDEQPDRDRTDESLAGERAKSDAALSELAAVEKLADVIVETAREEADEVLTAARARADQKLAGPAEGPAHARAVVRQERASEDQAVEHERAQADEALRQQRAANARLLARLIPVNRDKTDQHLLTERARADNALAHRDDFLGMVSHDLRDLLGGIGLTATTIAMQSANDEVGKQTRLGAERIQRAAGRMARLVNDLVDIASIDAGKLAIVLEQADGAHVVAEAIETWRAFASGKKILLEARSAGAVPVNIDRERILQVLGNLITNAVKFSPEGGTILLRVELVGSAARFSVKDDGSGIPREKLGLIFEKFWQVGKDDRRGLGLGLYIARCLVDAHGGTIWAESEPGAGSTFYFTVPAE